MTKWYPSVSASCVQLASDSGVTPGPKFRRFTPIRIGSGQSLAQVVRDLERARHALRDGLGQRDEGMDLTRVLAVDDFHTRVTQPIAVGASLLAQRIEARGDDHGSRLAGELRRAQRGRPVVRLVG